MYSLLIAETAKIALPKFEVSDYAPQSLSDVISHFNASGKIKVWSGASENTIWSREGNWLFRAWHDYCHILGQYEFNERGERGCLILQQSQTESTWLQKALHIEILEQFKFEQLTGQFPVDQVEFFKIHASAMGMVLK